MQQSNKHIVMGIFIALSVLGAYLGAPWDNEAALPEKPTSPFAVNPLSMHASLWHCESAKKPYWVCLGDPAPKKIMPSYYQAMRFDKEATAEVTTSAANLAFKEEQTHLFTVQLMAATQAENLKKLQHRYPELKEARIVQDNHNAHPLYRLIWGNYYTQSAAKKAMRNELDPHILALHPWVRSMAALSEKPALPLQR